MTDDDLVDLAVIPMTELKKEIATISSSSSIKFLTNLKQDIEDGIYQGKLEVQANVLFELYRNYCEKNNEHFTSHTKFGSNIKDKIEKKRKSQGFVYYLSTIKI